MCVYLIQKQSVLTCLCVRPPGNFCGHACKIQITVNKEKEPSRAERRHGKAHVSRRPLNEQSRTPLARGAVVFHHLQLDDVRVSEEFEILDLPLDLADDIEAADLLPVEDLDGDFMARQLMLAD